ncbi:hypothetical protein LDENG_00177790, partial [Lucifuga dentata]
MLKDKSKMKLLGQFGTEVFVFLGAFHLASTSSSETLINFLSINSYFITQKISKIRIC